MQSFRPRLAGVHSALGELAVARSYSSIADVTTFVVYHDAVTTVPIRTAKARLSEIVDQAIKTHDQVTITRNGVPAAVLVSSEEWEALQETLFWLSQGAERDVREGIAAYEAGETLSEEQVRRLLAGDGQ